MLEATIDMNKWVAANKGRVYRYVVYKKMFTPYEQEQKFSDESQFEDTHMTAALIEEAIPLGNGDWLFGFRQIIDGKLSEYVDYLRLSDIRLSCFDDDPDAPLEDEE